MNHNSTWFGGLVRFEIFSQLAAKYATTKDDVCLGIPNRPAALVISSVFFVLLIAKFLPWFRHLFLDTRGWSHRLFGGIHFGLLLFGAVVCWMEARAAKYQSGENNDDIDTLSVSLPFFSTRLSVDKASIALWYDLLLGCSGVATTLTAAKDFPHRLVRNRPGRSGSLHEEAIVTQAEMIEHSFYQGLNLLQALYLHALYQLSSAYFSDPITTMASSTTTTENLPIVAPWLAMIGPRILCLWIVTAPWLVRHRFPVHGFSQNWSKGSREPIVVATKMKKIHTDGRKQLDEQQQQEERDNGNDKPGGEILLYRIKKTQYLFYKHVILHGLNISMAIRGGGDSSSSSWLFSMFGQGNDNISANNYAHRHSIPYGMDWRIFWLLLNTSYSMEFFLQTLVKRKVLSQAYMMILQKLLMVAASLSAMNVLAVVRPEVCLISLALNYTHRHHDVINTMGIAIAFWLLDACLKYNSI